MSLSAGCFYVRNKVYTSQIFLWDAVVCLYAASMYKIVKGRCQQQKRCMIFDCAGFEDIRLLAFSCDFLQRQCNEHACIVLRSTSNDLHLLNIETMLQG